MGTTQGPGTWCGGPGLRPQTVHSLVMAGAFDGMTANRREAIVGRRAARPAPEERAEGPANLSTGDNVPELRGLHRKGEDGR